ncbi:MAG: alpha-amylase, partial [Agathobacter sp.]|nr:alpha-amylase [Agathobacter sp.]
MRKVKEHFHKKQGIFRRVFSLILVLAMIMTMIPSIGGNLNVKAASTPMNVTIHFMEPGNWGWKQPAVQFWGNSKDLLYVSNDANNGESTEISGWGGAKGYFFSKGTTNTKGDKDYYLTVKTDATGFQFLDFQNTGNTKNPANDPKLTQYTSDTPTDVYYITKDGSNFAYYLDAEGNTPVPDLPETETTFLLVGSLPGTGWETSATPNFVKSETNENEYSISIKNVPAKTYEYKILEDAALNGWDKAWAEGPNKSNIQLEVKAPADITMKLDKTDADKKTDVKFQYLKKLVADNGQITAGKPKKLATSANYYDGSGKEAEKVTVSYQLKDAPKGVTLEGDTITVAKESELTEVTVVAVYGEFKQEMTIPVVAKQYKVTINMYSPDQELKPGGSDVYIYENGGGANTTVLLDKKVEDQENGIIWVQGTTYLSYNNLGIIGKPKAGSWDGQDKNRYYVIDEDVSEITLWYVVGKTPVTKKPHVTVADPRYLCLEYENPDLGGKAPQFYSWTTGINEKEKLPFTPAGDGKWKIQARVSASCTKVDFVVVLDDSDASNWVKDGGDHTVAFPENQNVVCASIKKGEEPKLSAPYNKGYEVDVKAGKIHFYYRDDQALLAGN